MKTGTATYKVPGGKLLRIDVDYTDKIHNVKLTGDFFLHPEETLDGITTALTGLKLPLETETAVEAVREVLLANDAELIGANAADIVLTLAEALS